MLKWFRQYNKIILVVGCGVLMVAFLIPQAVTMFSPGGFDAVVGEVDGEEITQGDVRDARFELQLLDGLGLAPPYLTRGEPRYAAEHFLLMQREAEAMGLAASSAEINSAVQALGIDDAALAQISANFGGVDPQFVIQGIGSFLVQQRYTELLQGTAPDPNIGLIASPGLTQLQVRSDLVQQLQQPGIADNPMIQNQLQQVAQLRARGAGRLSAVASRAALRDMLTTVSGSVVAFPALVEDRHRNAVDEALINELFTTYRANARGAGEPFPFGYRQPDRVAIEALKIPYDAVANSIDIGYVEIKEAYDTRKSDFAGDDGTAPERPTAEARETLDAELRAERAQRLMRDIGNDLRGLFEQDTRGLPRSDRYLDLPNAFTPTPLDAVADSIEQKYGVRPEIIRSNGLITLEQAAVLPGLGQSLAEGVRGTRDAAFPALVAATRELLQDNQTASIAVQQDVIAPVTTADADGNRYLWRVTDAVADHEPAEMTEGIREAVRADAAQVLAFRELAERTDDLVAAVAAQGPEAAAEARNGRSQPVSNLPRRQMFSAAGGQEPIVPLLGPAPELVEKAFAVVADVPEDAELTAVKPADARTVGAALQRQLSVGVMQIDSFTRPDAAQFEQQFANTPRIGIESMVLRPGDLGDIANPLSLEAVAERLNFDLASIRDEDDPENFDLEGDLESDIEADSEAEAESASRSRGTPDEAAG